MTAAEQVVRRLLSEYALAPKEDPLSAVVDMAADEHPEWWTLEELDIPSVSSKEWDNLASLIAANIASTYHAELPPIFDFNKLVDVVRKTFP